MTQKEKALFTKWNSVCPVCDICGRSHMTQDCSYNNKLILAGDEAMSRRLPQGFNVVSLQEMAESMLTTEEDLWCDTSEIRKAYEMPKDKVCPKCGATMLDEGEELHCFKCGTLFYK